jgi:low affinity Fe/Cu permease
MYSFEARGGDLHRRRFAFGVYSRLHFWKAGAVGVVFAHTRIDGMARPTAAGANGRWNTRARIGCVLSRRSARVTVFSFVATVTIFTVMTVSAVAWLASILDERPVVAVATVVTLPPMLVVAVLVLLAVIAGITAILTLPQRFAQTVALEESAVVQAVEDELEGFVVISRLERENVVGEECVAAVLDKNFGKSLSWWPSSEGGLV